METFKGTESLKLYIDVEILLEYESFLWDPMAPSHIPINVSSYNDNVLCCTVLCSKSFVLPTVD